MKNEIRISGSSGVTLSDVRQVAGGAPEIQPERTERAVKLLFLAANPAGTTSLRLDREVKAIDAALRASRSAASFELEQHWAVEERDVQDALLRHRPDIVHLSGHGDADGGLVLEPDMTAGRRRSGALGAAVAHPDALARLFAAAPGGIRCAVLNVCGSLVAARLIAEQVGCAIGMTEAIEDAAALRFSWAFYNALGYGVSVRGAFDLAAAQVALGGWSKGDVPRLVATRVDPAQVVFV